MIALMLMLTAATSQGPSAARDSTLTVVSVVADKVAELRSAYELLRRAAYNDGDSATVHAAGAYGNSCLALSETIQQQQHRICRSCMEHRLQRAVDLYRAYLPSLQAFGRKCASRVAALVPAHPTTASMRVLRHELDPLMQSMVQGLSNYELRVQGIRSAMGMPPRGALPPGPPR